MKFSDYIPLVGQILGQAGAFLAGQPITLQIPAEKVTLDLTADGIGKVQVEETGTTIKITKV